MKSRLFSSLLIVLVPSLLLWWMVLYLLAKACQGIIPICAWIESLSHTEFFLAILAGVLSWAWMERELFGEDFRRIWRMVR